MRVVVTHAGGAFARVLVRALRADAGIEQVTTIDPQDAEAAKALPGHDALVHVPPFDAALSAGADVEPAVRPAHKLFHAAHAAGIGRLMHVSTAAVYGAAIHAHEHSQLRPHERFVYAREQAHLEQLLAIDFPQCVRLRPHLVAGPHADLRLKRALGQPFYPRWPDPQPLFQCVHEDDLAAAVLRALQGDARGVYNIAPEDSVTLKDAIRGRRMLSFALAPARMRSALQFATRRLGWELDPGWVDLASETLLVNCRRAVSELGWRCRHTSLEALAAT